MCHFYGCYVLVARVRLRRVDIEGVCRKYFTISFGDILDNFSDNALRRFRWNFMVSYLLFM